MDEKNQLQEANEFSIFNAISIGSSNFGFISAVSTILSTLFVSSFLVGYMSSFGIQILLILETSDYLKFIIILGVVTVILIPFCIIHVGYVEMYYKYILKQQKIP